MLSRFADDGDGDQRRRPILSDDRPVERAEHRTSEAPLIDEASINSLIGVLGTDGFATLLGKLNADGTDRIDRMRALSARDGEADALAMVAHSLKSALGTLGLAHARRLATEIESDARQNPGSDLAEKVAGLADLFAASIRAVEHHLSALENEPTGQNRADD